MPKHESQPGSSKETSVETKPKLIFADRGEKIVEYKGHRPYINDIFDLTINPHTQKKRAIAVPINNLPAELAELLSYSGYMDYLATYRDEIIFTRVLKRQGSYLPGTSTNPSSETTVAGVIVNPDLEEFEGIRPGKRTMFINIGKTVHGKKQPKLDIEMYHTVVHETRHAETEAKIKTGEEPIENMENTALSEIIAYTEELKALGIIAYGFEANGLTNDPKYTYVKETGKSIKSLIKDLRKYT